MSETEAAGARAGAHNVTALTQIGTAELQEELTRRAAAYEAEFPARHLASLEAKVEKAREQLAGAEALLASERDRYAAEAAARDQEQAAAAEEGTV